MIRCVAAAIAALLATGPAAAVPYRDLAKAFESFADRTAGLPDPDRLSRFDAEIRPRFPDFYKPQDDEPAAQYRARVLAALEAFPGLRARYDAVRKIFPSAYAAGLQRVRDTFADFRNPDGTVFLHSLGELDGGTRRIGNRNLLLFGADGIALYHAPDSLGAFLDHELFHVEHGRFFADCQAVWCGLWEEGLATYAATKLAPGADDRLLMLDTPQPIRATVDAHWHDAICLLAAKSGSTSKADYGLFFFGNPNGTPFPPRFGYYLGLRVAERAASRYSLPKLAHLSQADARPVVTAILAEMAGEAGGCRSPAPERGTAVLPPVPGRSAQ